MDESFCIITIEIFAIKTARRDIGPVIFRVTKVSPRRLDSWLKKPLQAYMRIFSGS